MIVTIAELNSYLNNFESSSEVTALKQSVVESAEAVVIDYLGYNPIAHIHEEYYMGSGNKYLYPDAKHILSFNYMTEDEEYIEDVCQRNDAFYRKAGFDPNREYYVSYVAGWRPELMPAIIKTTILRIASLMWLETGGNIGLSARTSPDNSKTFISYNNYNKYLAPLESYRIIRF